MAAIIIFAFISLLAATLQKVYAEHSLKELKKRARRQDKRARSLHRAVAFGLTLSTFLWLVMLLSNAAFVLLVSKSWGTVAAYPAVFALLFLCYFWLPSAKTSKPTALAATYLARPIAWALQLLHPMLYVISKAFKKRKLVSQKHSPVAEQTSSFGDKTAGSVMTPREHIRFVKAKEAAGPILMDELYKTGFAYFPVVAKKQNEVIGTLDIKNLLKNLNSEYTKSVEDIMSREVYYVHENKSLSTVLDAYLKTKHNLFVVINSFKDVVGVITTEDLMKEIIGEPGKTNFNSYDDPEAVAQHGSSTDPLKSDDEMVE